MIQDNISAKFVVAKRGDEPDANLIMRRKNTNYVYIFQIPNF